MSKKIYIINLERCAEKKIKMEERLRGEEYEIIKAFDGKKLDDTKLHILNAQVLKAWKDPWSGRNITWGEVGCALSHYAIYERCIKENIENAIILEDDVTLPENFSSKIDDCLNKLGEIHDWEFCYLGRKPMDSKDKEIGNANFVKSGYSYWMCSYIINLKGMKKIVDSGFKENIIPIDEILPILGRVSPYTAYSKYYCVQDSLKMYSLRNLLCSPENGAFARSETENSNEVEYYDDNLLLLATGTDMTDGLKRFIKSCRTYGLKYKIMGLNTKWNGGNMALGPGGGQKINLLYDTLTELRDDQLILVTDSYDVIMSANSKEIIDKYKKFNKKIVFASESSCWPDKSMMSRYPKVSGRKNIYLNSGGFMGDVKTIKSILSTVPNNCDDQEWYARLFLSEKGRELIALDYNCELFQCLNDAENELQINFSKSRIYNKVSHTYPCQIHGNGGSSRKLLLNTYENYLMKNWTDTYGYNCKNMRSLEQNKSLTLMVIFQNDGEKDNFELENSKAFVEDNIQELKTVVPNVEVRYCEMSEKNLNVGLKKAVDLHVDYCWIINPSFIITNKETLKKLIEHKKGIISPVVSKPGLLWSNFWGNIDSNGWYAQSFDYVDIVERKKKGCWNVPHISGNILIEKEYIAKVQNFFTNNSGNTHFMTSMFFSHNCRRHNLSMFVINDEEYGYILGDEKDEIPTDAISKSLYSFSLNTDVWAKRYLHPEFLKCINNWDKLEVEEPCKFTFKFPFVNERFCDELLSEVQARAKWSSGEKSAAIDHRINNVENFPTQDIHLKQIGFRKQWEKIVKKYIAPLVSHIFSPYKTKGLNISFVVKYEMGKQQKLSPHHDSSTYSINITLNNQGIDFTGGGTRFIKQNVTVEGKRGWALIHPGRLTHYHEGLPITSGKRYIFVSFVD